MNEKNIVICEAFPEDAEEILNIYAPYVTDTAITTEYDVPELSEFRERIVHIKENYPYIKAVAEDGSIVGYAYAGVFHPRIGYAHCVETSIYVKTTERKTGIGRMLYEELEKRLSEIGITNLYACISSPTVEDQYLTHNSERFHERLGYKECGRFTDSIKKFDRFYDMVYMEKIL